MEGARYLAHRCLFLCTFLLQMPMPVYLSLSQLSMAP